MFKGKKTAAGLLLAAALLAPLTAGGNKDSEPAKRIFTDSLGREVSIPQKIERISPSGPLAQQVLYAVAPEKLVSIAGEWSKNAAEFITGTNLPVTGQFYGKGVLNLKTVVQVNPDVVIDIGERKAGIKEDLDKLQAQIGIPVVFVEATLPAMEKGFTMLGGLLGKEKDAKVLANYCEKTYRTVTTAMAKIEKEGRKVRGQYSLGADGTHILAKGSYHAEVLDLMIDNTAVVEKVVGSGKGNASNFEQFYLWNPDFVIFEPNGAYAAAGTDERFLNLAAIKNKRYVEVPDKPYNWLANPPSINRYMGMVWLAKLLYPEDFSFTMYDEIKTIFKLFYHAELTQEQFADITKNAHFK